MKDHTIGIICGCNLRAAKKLKEVLQQQAKDPLKILMTDEEIFLDRTSKFAMSDRKIALYNEIITLIRRGANIIAVPDFTSTAFLTEIQAEVSVPLLGIGSVVAKMMQNTEQAIGLLIPAGTKDLISQHSHHKVLYPSNAEQDLLNVLRWDIHVGLDYEAIRALTPIAKRLCQDGAGLLVPHCINLALLGDRLTKMGYPTMPVFSYFAKSILHTTVERRTPPFQLGIIGCERTKNTLDFHERIVNEAHRSGVAPFPIFVSDMPIARMMLTDNKDATFSLYHSAKHLQNEGCSCIATTSHAAHAYWPYLQRHLSIPCIDMIGLSLERIVKKEGTRLPIGLLATQKTIDLGLYQQKAHALGCRLHTLDARHQRALRGVIQQTLHKRMALHRNDTRPQVFLDCVQYLVEKMGCQTILLGDVAAPLNIPKCTEYRLGNTKIRLLDPHSVLIQHCIRLARLYH